MEDPGMLISSLTFSIHELLSNLCHSPPVAEIPHVIHTLCQATPSKQRAALEKYFTPSASFTHPICRTGSFNGSRWLIWCIYRWYKVMSPRIELGVDSVGRLAVPPLNTSPLGFSSQSNSQGRRQIVLTQSTYSFRSKEPNPLRLLSPVLPHMGPSHLLRPRLPRHRPAPRARPSRTLRPYPRADPDQIPDQSPKRPLPSQRDRPVRQPIWDPLDPGGGAAAVRDRAVRARRGRRLAGHVGGGERAGREPGAESGGSGQGLKGMWGCFKLWRLFID